MALLEAPAHTATTTAEYTSRSPSRCDHHPGHGPSGRIGLELHHFGVDQQGDVRPVQDRTHRDDLGVGLGVHQAGVAVAPGAADTCAASPVGLVEHDPHRRREGMVTTGLEGVGDLLQAGLVADRRPRIRLGPVALGGVLVPVAVHLVQPLGLGVPRLEVVVVERPGRRQPVHVGDLPEVLRSQPVQGGAVELGRPAHEIVDLRLERRPVAVVPGVGRDVLPVDEHRVGIPVVHLSRQKVAPLEEQDPLPGWRQGVGQGSAPGTGPDDDHVVVVSHGSLLRSQEMVYRPGLECMRPPSAKMVVPFT